MLIDFIVTIFVLFMSVIFHECAHGWVAYKLGDPTAKMAGRLTLNPLRHVDPVGTIFIPGVLIVMRLMGMHTFLFGWAKPVPVNFGRLHHPRTDMIWVGLAGPAVNILLAVIFSRLALLNVSLEIYHFAETVVFINLLLAIFNMIPIPPLDGSRLIMGILPRKLAISYSHLERYGILIIVFLVSAGAFEFMLPILGLAGKILGMEFL